MTANASITRCSVKACPFPALIESGHCRYHNQMLADELVSRELVYDNAGPPSDIPRDLLRRMRGGIEERGIRIADDGFIERQAMREAKRANQRDRLRKGEPKP